MTIEEKRWKEEIRNVLNGEDFFNVWILCPKCLKLIELDYWGILYVLEGCSLDPASGFAEDLHKEFPPKTCVFQLDCLYDRKTGKLEVITYEDEEEENFYDDRGYPVYSLLPPVFHYRTKEKDVHKICTPTDQWDIPMWMSESCIALIKEEENIYAYFGENPASVNELYGEEVVKAFKKILRRERILLDLAGSV